MKKVNFKEVKVKDIEDVEQTIDVRKELGNVMYMQGQNIVECELGHDIYHSEGDIELSDEQVQALKPYLSKYPFFIRRSIEQLLN